MALITRLVLALVGDALFEATSSRVRAYESEIERYFDERGFRRPNAPPSARSS
jgi:hypothetical protein